MTKATVPRAASARTSSRRGGQLETESANANSSVPAGPTASHGGTPLTATANTANAGTANNRAQPVRPTKDKDRTVTIDADAFEEYQKWKVAEAKRKKTAEQLSEKRKLRRIAAKKKKENLNRTIPFNVGQHDHKLVSISSFLRSHSNPFPSEHPARPHYEKQTNGFVKANCLVCAHYHNLKLSNEVAATVSSYPKKLKNELSKPREKRIYRTSYCCALCSIPYMGREGIRPLHVGRCFEEWHGLSDQSDSDVND